MAGGRGGRRRRSCRGTLSVLTPTRQPPEGRASVRGCVDGLWTGSDLGLLALSPLFLASGSCLVRRTAWCTSGTFRRRRWCRSCRATRVSLGRGLLRRSGRWCRDGRQRSGVSHRGPPLVPQPSGACGGSGRGVGLSGPPAGQGQFWLQSPWPPAGCPASLSTWLCTGPTSRAAQGGGTSVNCRGCGSRHPGG